ncbi:hypothetical protein NEOLI_003241 [Neolecta irregularis DAH-3]|uniref:Uncharacterized protein n=1 Tax=Neolecta irregularis (strain DAH-3) TaxID=1198029 RepID=A0A1U7LS49_NEOID|nr:hypothetical protein NEOLI_003241 [Neolecta irregularis DAH-3]|eukprot:OLL25487.1 hypothetical protein NEOLI_003241 [Neolecta irregularis DAH-3]
MPSTAKRLAQVASHISNAQTLVSNNNITYHDLNPTVFLPRAAAIEPKAPAIVHKSSTGRDIRRTYQEFADRARGLAYFIKLKCGNGNIGILAPNTPLPLEVFFAQVLNRIKH